MFSYIRSVLKLKKNRGKVIGKDYQELSSGAHFSRRNIEISTYSDQFER